jgi:hypothetical protein
MAGVLAGAAVAANFPYGDRFTEYLADYFNIGALLFSQSYE